MTTEQFLVLLFIRMKGHTTTARAIHKQFGNDEIAFLVDNNYIEYKPYGKVMGYYYVTLKGEHVCVNITTSLKLIY